MAAKRPSEDFMHLYRASGVAVGGSFTKIHGRRRTALLPAQAAAVLSIVGGRAEARIEKFKFEDFLSFDAAYTELGGSFDEEHNIHTTYAHTVIEGLHI